jgi:predicted ATPase
MNPENIPIQDTSVDDDKNESIPIKPEELSFPTYEVTIDKSMLEGLPEVMREWLERLPDTFAIDEQATLIVGDNGSGKTTLAKAISLARAMESKTNNPSLRQGSLILPNEDPAVLLAKALTIREEGAESYHLGTFIDGPEVIGHMRAWAYKQSWSESGTRVEDNRNDGYTHRRSTRQLFEQGIEEIRENIKRNARRLQVINKGAECHADYIFDEPEVGLSPKGQEGLVGMIEQFSGNGETVLVPTNSVVLALSNLPRIDLSQPERGCFTPTIEELREAARALMPHLFEGEIAS